MLTQMRFWDLLQRGVVVVALLSCAPGVPVTAASSVEPDFFASELIARESGKVVSMDFKDASLTNVLKIFSQQSGLNFVADQAVQERKVTLFLDKVPVQEALNKIMKAHNLKYEMEPGQSVFIVMDKGTDAVETMTKAYKLQYAIISNNPGEEEGESSSSEGSSKASESVDEAKLEEVEWLSIMGAIKGILTEKGGVIADPRTNTLIVTDVPEQFERVDKVIALLDVPAPQVMIEVEMLDVSKETIDQIGVNYSGELIGLQGGARDTLFPFSSIKDGWDQAGTFSYGVLSSEMFVAVLNAITTDSRTKYLARPRILTMNNQLASIAILTQEAIGQNTVTSASEGTAETTQEAERFPTGVALQVIPIIDTQSGNVTMAILPVVSEAKLGATFNGTTYKDPETRSTRSIVMVRDGETIVLGGLIRDTEELTVKKFPFLGDLPFIGAAFRYKDETKSQRELVVFLTPHIIGPKEALAFAKSGSLPGSPLKKIEREQSSSLSRKKEIDRVMEKWGR